MIAGPSALRHSARWVDLGREGYLETLALQRELLRRRQEGEIPDTFLVVEHPPCLTIGQGGAADNVLVGEAALGTLGVSVHRCDRGGDVTYHGPGQLVCYPIVDLAGYGCDVHAHVRRLEAMMIEAAAAFGVPTWRRPGYPGVWTAAGKIGAVGVAVRRWVTMHGAALNVCPDMRGFSLIVPCGLAGTAVTSLAEVLDHVPSLPAARAALRDACELAFDRRLEDADGRQPAECREDRGSRRGSQVEQRQCFAAATSGAYPIQGGKQPTWLA